MRKSFLREAVWQCAAAGLTCVQTHEFGEGWSAAEAWGVYAQLQAEGNLPLRVELTTSWAAVSYTHLTLPTKSTV